MSIISVMDREVLYKVKAWLMQQNISHTGIITPKEIVLKEMYPLCNTSIKISSNNSIKDELEASIPEQLFFNGVVGLEHKKNVFVKEVYEIIKNLREAYMDDANNRPFVLCSSFGKDSCMLIFCMWTALIEIREEFGIDALKRKVFIVSSDTGLEMPEVREYMYKCINAVQQEAIKERLPIETKIVEPDLNSSFAVKVIGKGVTISTGRSRRRNCTFWFKIEPMDKFIQEIVTQYGEVVIHLGVRHLESELRNEKIIKYRGDSNNEGFIIPHTKPKQFVCHPIKNLSTDELWDTLKNYENDKLPFGIPYSELFALYQNSNECPMQVSNQNKQSCGTNRNGCFVCQMIDEDKMLLFQRDVQKKEWAAPLLTFRSKFREMLFDVAFRRHPSKHKLKEVDKYNPFIETKEEVTQGLLGKNGMKPRLYKRMRSQKIDRFNNNHRGITIDTKPIYPNIMTGSLSLKARIFLLKNALWYQRLARVEFVSENQIQLIKKVWKEEFNWIENEEDLKAEPVELYDDNWGVLEIDANFQVKLKETTIPNLHLPEEYNYKRNDYKKGKKKGDSRILNEDPNKPNNYMFYIHRQFSGNEKIILDILETAEKKTQKTVPFYFSNGWTTENDKKLYWNVVTFIVCVPNIISRVLAEQYIDDYILKGLVEEEINWDI